MQTAMQRAVETSFDAVSVLSVQPGLYALRYVSAVDAANWPVAEVLSADGSEGDITTISAPGAAPGGLEGPGACVVVVAHAPASLKVGVKRRGRSGSIDAVLRLEPLDVAERGAQAPSAATSAASAPQPIENLPPKAASPSLQIFAHVARRGDVEALAGEWIAGPQAPAPIEGLQFRATESLGVEAQALLAGARWTPWTPPGAFLGTRGRALPIVGLRLRLVGARSLGAEIVAEAMFLGAAIVEKRGSEIELLGRYAADPLVGLKLHMIFPLRQSRPAEKAAANSTPETRVHVFRPTMKAAS